MKLALQMYIYVADILQRQVCVQYVQGQVKLDFENMKEFDCINRIFFTKFGLQQVYVLWQRLQYILYTGTFFKFFFI